ncbi:MAG: 3-deoxy-manno-octulosonate cytidylyltransferase, partial [Methylococcaceae bacterium]|nr:3-deoxy-manno-octulosonate cytidylyltransferase [Methylococcaceae bacterium]
MSGVKIVIPARHGSSRLPGKPLLNIAGKPMIVHVCERALEAGKEVYVATDDERISAAVAGLPVTAVMTREDHGSGTERIAEVADQLGWPDDTLVVNLQGDEPLMQPELIRQLAETLATEASAEIATLAAPIEDPADVFDPHAVKVVLDRHGHALYFSRAPIPWHRESFAQTDRAAAADFPWLRHIGIYAYTAGFLRRYVNWPASRLESVEALEQLRILWQGERIRVLTVASAPHAGVDTEADLRRV